LRTSPCRVSVSQASEQAQRPRRRTSDDRGVPNGLPEIILFLFSTIACAEYIPVYAKLTDGTGNVSKTAYLHFELQNCGANFPTVPGNSQVVVQTAFDIKPNQSDGSILGQVNCVCRADQAGD
jgi:hypothetical protein